MLLFACDRPRPRLHGCLRGQHAAASTLGADNPGFQSHRRRPRSAEQHSALRNDRAFALGRTRGRPFASQGKQRRPKLQNPLLFRDDARRWQAQAASGGQGRRAPLRRKGQAVLPHLVQHHRHLARQRHPRLLHALALNQSPGSILQGAAPAPAEQHHPGGLVELVAHPLIAVPRDPAANIHLTRLRAPRGQAEMRADIARFAKARRIAHRGKIGHRH